MVINFAIFLTLCWLFLIRPIKRELALRQEQDFQEKLYLFQLKAVRAHYAELQNLNYEEIHERYHVKDAYYSMR